MDAGGIVAHEIEAAEPQAKAGEAPVIVIEPSSGWSALHLGEVWHYRELLYFLTWRDIKLRYKQTLIGAAWAVIQPLLTMLIFSVVFGRLVGVPSDGIPYPIFAYAGLVPWTFFALALTQAGMSLVRDANLISKVYFPRLVAPLATVLSGLVDFGIAFAVLLVLMAFYGVLPGLAILTIPLFLLLAILSSFGISLWFAALNVKYRDIRYTIPFLIQIWLFLTPIAYPSSLIPERWQLIYGLNPMAGVIEGFRWALLGTPQPSPGMLIVSTIIVGVIFAGGLFYFRRAEHEFADVI